MPIINLFCINSVFAISVLINQYYFTLAVCQYRGFVVYVSMTTLIKFGEINLKRTTKLTINKQWNVGSGMLFTVDIILMTLPPTSPVLAAELERSRIQTHKAGIPELVQRCN